MITLVKMSLYGIDEAIDIELAMLSDHTLVMELYAIDGERLVTESHQLVPGVISCMCVGCG